MTLLQYGIVAAVALTVTLGVTPLVRTVGTRWGIVAHPGGRHVHSGVIPRIGGVAMFLGITAGLAVEYLGERLWGFDRALVSSGSPLVGVMFGGILMFAVGLLDDIFDLRPWQKLAGQVVAATIVVAYGLKISFLSNPFGGGIFLLGVLSVPITVFWIVGFANVVNLMDGLDGLAAGITAIAAVSFFVLALQQTAPAAALLAAVVFGACIGFLRFNFHPASIFMGDAGALLLGFVLACIALLGVMKSVAAITLVVPLLIIGVPLFDTVSAIIRRRRHGQPIQMADKGHIHHRLLGRGFSPRQTVIIIYVWSVALAVGGYAMRWAPTILRVITLVILASLSGLMAYWLGLFEAVHHDDE